MADADDSDSSHHGTEPFDENLQDAMEVQERSSVHRTAVRVAGREFSVKRLSLSSRIFIKIMCLRTWTKVIEVPASMRCRARAGPAAAMDIEEDDGDLLASILADEVVPDDSDSDSCGVRHESDEE